MPGTDFGRPANAQSPLRGLLEAFSRLEQLPAAQPAQRPQIDPEKARKAILGALELITAETEDGQRAREALHRIACAARDLLRMAANRQT